MGSGALVNRGSVVIVELPQTYTHEQSGKRPCIVVSSEDSIANARYDMLVIIPLTTAILSGRLYPHIKKGDANLKSNSVALADQIRSIDKKRVKHVGSQVSPKVMSEMDSAIKHLLGYE